MIAVTDFTTLPVGVVPLIPALAGILPVILAAIGGAIVSLLKPSVLKAMLKVLWRNKFVVLAIVVAVVGLVYLKGYLNEKFGRGAGAAMQGQADWSAFRGGPDRRGAVESDNHEDPVAGGVFWTFAKEAKTFYSSPALVGDSVLIASAEQGVFKDQGAIYRLDASTGAVIWRYMPKGYRATFSSPSYWERPATNNMPAKGYVVCGEGLHFTADARIVCLSADKGEELWTVRTKSHVESSAAIMDGKVFIGAGDDGFYCVDLEPKDGKANVLWHLDGKEYPDCEACPAAVNGKVYMGLGMGGMAVVCFDAETGKELWKANTPYPVFGNPTVVSNRVFIGMGNGNFVETAEQVRVKELDRLKARKVSVEEIEAADKQLSLVNGEVWCLDADDGKLIWSNKVGRVVLGSIVHADGYLYVGSCDGALTCFDLDGKFIHVWNAHEPIKTSPAVTREHVYFMTDSGRLYALDRKDFRKPVWQCRVGTGGLFISSPVVGNGHVYVGTAGSGFMCLGEAAGQIKEYQWQGFLGGHGRGGWADKTPPANQGRFAWRFPAEEDDDDGKVASIDAPVAVGSNAVFVAQNGVRKGLLKLALDEERRKIASEQAFFATANGIFISPALQDEHVYFVDGKKGDTGRKLHCLKAGDLGEVSSYDVADNASGEFVLCDDCILMFDGETGLTLLDPITLKAQWRADIAGAKGAPIETKGIVIYASDADSSVVALSKINGKVLWQAKLGALPVTGPLSDGDLVVVGTEVGVIALSIIDGSEKWNSPCGSISSALVANSERIACVTQNGELAGYDWSGKELFKIGDAKPGLAPLLCGEGALYFSKDSINQFDASSSKSSVWLARIGWLGKVTAPGVLSDGFLYFGTDSKGLVCVGPR